MMYGRARWQEAEATIEDFNTVLIRQDKKFLISELFKVVQDAVLIDPTLQNNVVLLDGFFFFIYHVGCAINVHSIINSGLILGGQNLSNRQTVFLLPVDSVDKNHKDPDTIDFNASRHAQYIPQAWKKHQNPVYWVDINLALRKGVKTFQTRSNAVILHETLPACCIQKLLGWKLQKPYTRKYMRHPGLLPRSP